MSRLPLARAILPLASLAFVPSPAQAQGSSEELHVYGGKLFGEALTTQPLPGNDPLAGTYPRLADHLTYGARYDHNFTPTWGMELAVGQTPTYTARYVQPGVDRLRLRAADLDVTWNFTPGHPIVGYTLMGAGYARVRLDPALPSGPASTLEGRDAVTGNVGIGARAYATRHLIFRAEIRYRYFTRLVTPDGRGLSTFETTAGLGWRF
jgi:outer membrane beta-barrel protein